MTICFPLRRALLGAAAGLAMLAGDGGTALAATKINLGIVPWIGYGPIYVAAAKGYFAAQGLDVNMVNFDDPAAIPPAVYSGQVNAGTETYDQVIGTNAKGWHMKVVMPIDYSAGADAMVSTDDITSVSQLKGLKVAYAALTPSDFLLGYALKQVGLSKDDITSVNVPAEGVPGVMAGGSTKAGVTYEPSVTGIVKAEGGNKFHVLFSSKQAPGLITDVLVVTPKTIKNDPAMITAFIKAFVQGEAYIKSNPDDAYAIVGKALGEGPADAKAQYAGVVNPPLSEMPGVLAKSDKLPSFWASGPVIGGLLKSEGQITAIPAIEDTYDASFINAEAGVK
ncbi:MAG TPA: ABC transporter substrate-binding protein [Acidocella sp.]|jgi:NitT/TauT family transport system substrate-binding protein|nr:ABC transporter substrate-binding protein [Acidocella sp.]